jgi:uroporphyrinogen decarboxylase
MTSRERVIAACQHEQPDRVPFDLGSSLVTGITRNAYIALAGELRVSVSEPALYDTVQQLAELDEAMVDALEVDVRGIIPNFKRKNPPLSDWNGEPSFVDEFGVRYVKPGKALYFDVAESPLAGDITVDDVMAMPMPDPADPAMLAGLEEKARDYHDRGYAVMLDSICAGLFEMACRVRGYEDFYMDLAGEPEIAEAILDRFVDLKIGFYEAAAEKLGPYIQFIREGDDMAGQEALLMSPAMYTNYMKPRHKRLFDAQKGLFPEPFFIFFHSDGAIRNILPDFIEIGVDVLNPVQLTAQGMDADDLKREFGKDLVFWGGGVNTQGSLPNGTPDEVREDVRRRVESFRADGGYVFGTVHNVQDDVPAENAIAMLEAFRSLRDY